MPTNDNHPPQRAPSPVSDELANARREMRECFPFVYEDGRELYDQIRLLKELLVQELTQARQELNRLGRRITP